MLCQQQIPTRQDSLSKDQNQIIMNLQSNNSISKRHTIASFYEGEHSNTIESTLCRTFEDNNNKHLDKSRSYWETIESYYVSRLDSLQKEIEASMQQNLKLSTAREELVQEVLKLHNKSMELSSKNDVLARSIAEKENHISAFMYNQPQQPQPSYQQQQQQQRHQYSSVVGVTLVDQPLSPPTPTLPPTLLAEGASDISNLSSNSTFNKPSPPLLNEQPQQSDERLVPVKKETGIFRQISLRLSGKKRRQHDETQQQSSMLQISDPVSARSNNGNTDAIVPAASSSSDPILHPAVVISSPENRTETKTHQLADDMSNNKRKKNLVFGNDLILQARSENSVIPSVVLKCIREVESRGLTVEGIYRKSGTLAHVKELQDAFDENKNPKLSKHQDIHVIASLLKLYFRELSSPLIPNEFILPSSLSDQERLNKTYTLLHNMPIESYCTIKFLVQHLKRVHQNQAVNRMPLKNLAVVFGPTLMRFVAGNEEHQMKEMISTVEFIILQSHILFADYS